jgi:hypothetical protein
MKPNKKTNPIMITKKILLLSFATLVLAACGGKEQGIDAIIASKDLKAIRPNEAPCKPTSPK